MYASEKVTIGGKDTRDMEFCKQAPEAIVVNIRDWGPTRLRILWSWLFRRGATVNMAPAVGLMAREGDWAVHLPPPHSRSGERFGGKVHPLQ